MIDKSRPRCPRKGRQTLPVFTPVPRQRERHYGWTPERQRGFIEALADTGSVKHAAHAVNMTPEGAYLLRRHPEAGEFRRAWEAALSLGVQKLEDVAMERALHGVEVPVYSYGKIIGTRRVYNDRLLMFVLRNRAGKRFAQGIPQAIGAAGRSQLERLKREWRAEWEAEAKKQQDYDPREVRAEFHARIAGLHTSYVQAMNAETRRLYLAFRLSRHAQKYGTTLAALGVDPHDPDCDLESLFLHHGAPLPTTVREQLEELGGDADTAESYLKPKVDWRNELEDDEGEDE